jgi:ankyrin repeat protein
MQQESKSLLDKNSERILPRISQDEILQVKNAIAEFVSEISAAQNEEQKRGLMNVRFGVSSNTILHLAAKFGDDKDIAKILEQLSQDQEVNAINADYFSPLHFAAINGHLKATKLLIAAGANKNAAASERKRSWTPIHYAAQFNHVEVVKFLIESGVNKEVKTGFGLTPLVVAAEFGSNESLEFLLLSGADKNVQTIAENHKMTALHYAVIGNFAKSATLLLDAAVDKDKETDSGFTALDFAAKNNLSEMAVLLMSYGADKWDGALKIAQENKSEDVVRQIKKYQKAKLKLFNSAGLENFAPTLTKALKQFDPKNLGETKIILDDGVALNAFGILSLSHYVGLFSKEKRTFPSFVLENGLMELEKELKRLAAIVASPYFGR